MVTLRKESELFYDEELTRLLKGIKKGGAEDFEETARALNIRAMPALADKVSREGAAKYPKAAGILKELILANTLSPETLRGIGDLVRKSQLEKDQLAKISSLLGYYMDDPAWSEYIEENETAPKDRLYFELWGHRFMELGQFSRAVKTYERASAEAGGRDPRHLYYKAEALKASGDLPGAFRELLGATKNFSCFVQGWNGLARVYLEEGKLHLAYQAIGKALSINPSDWGAFLALADFYLNHGEHGRARGVLEILLSLEPSKPVAAEIFNYAGYLYSLDNRFQEAQSALERALRLNPKLAEAWYNLGNIVFHKKSFDEALACYERAAASDPKMATAFTQIGLTLLEMGKVCNADKPLHKALELDPSEYLAHLGLSEFHRRARDGRNALKHAQMALKIENSDPNIHNILGIAYEFEREFADAEKAYKKALELDPMHRWAANNLGYLYERLMKTQPKYRKLAVEAWKKRLLICCRTGASIKGALNHLLKLGVQSSDIKRWIKASRS